MKKQVTFFIFLLIFIFSLVQAQTWDSNWSVEYVTSDSPDSLNSVGYNVISVTTLAENSFVALTNRGSANAHYLVGYRNANKNEGRVGIYPYQQPDLQTKWINFFDQELVFDANDLASNGNLVYVANNFVDNSDQLANSILVFDFKEDSLYSHPQRFKIGEYIWGIDTDANGRVYVTKLGDSVNVGSVLILDNPDNTPTWSSSGNTGTILYEFDLPEVGEPRGITVNDGGNIIYVSNFDENKVYCFVYNSTSDDYELYEGFNFQVDGEFQSANELFNVGPFGLQLMPDKNLLFVSHDASFKSGEGYEYGRIYVVNPNTGEVIDTLNTAEWNFYIEGQYDNHDQTNNASGYTSNYAVDFDENYNVYTQSWFGWTVDKWVYDGDLPTIELTLTSVEKLDDVLPTKISLDQNYPNPFNPTTTIRFSVNAAEEISISIYNITGELITELIKNTNFSAGSYEVTFDASKLASGTYIYKLNVGDNVLSKKMILLK